MKHLSPESRNQIFNSVLLLIPLLFYPLVLLLLLFSSYRWQSLPVSFLLDNLQQETSYRILLFAVNPKGRSEPTVIDDVRCQGIVKYSGELHAEIRSRTRPLCPSNSLAPPQARQTI